MKESAFPLFPIIISALKRAGATNLKDLDIQSLNVNGYFYAPMDDGRLIGLPFERVESVIDLIRELYNFDTNEAVVEPERLPAILSHIKVMPTERIKKLAKQLEKLGRIEPIETPEDFGAELRQYQKGRSGLAELSN